MHTTEYSIIKELPETIDLTRNEERRKIDELGRIIAVKERLHYEGYAAYTAEPYSIEKAKTILYFN